MKPNLILGVTSLVLFQSLAAQETRRPVISRMQVVYSIVAHRMINQTHAAFYDESGSPAGNENYAIPYLVYDPVVTLYNPYNTSLTLTSARVRLSDPPVGFRFKKNDRYLRSEWGQGTFYGLGRFQSENESNRYARKEFVLTLGGGNKNSYSGRIVLQPGESRTFGVRTEDSWTWGYENAFGTPRLFFDWLQARGLTTKDGRTNNSWGVEAVAGLDWRGGFQTDNLASVATRPAGTRYSFETGTYGSTSWVAIRDSDTFTLEARGVDTTGQYTPDFQLALLRGVTPYVDQDVYHGTTYSFNIASLVQPSTPSPYLPSISRTYRMRSLLQAHSDKTPGGKMPFASFVIAAKSKALQQRRFQQTTAVKPDELYETRLDSLDGFTDPRLFDGPRDAPGSGIVVTNVERVFDSLMIDLAAPPSAGTTHWKVKGTEDPSAGFPDDLTAGTVITEGPADTGIYKAKVPIPDGKDRYFVRFEY